MYQKTFINPLAFQLSKGHMEHTSAKSLTVPNESYSIRELYKKFTTGVGPQVGKEPKWDPNATFDSDDLEKLSNKDLFEIEEYKRGLADKMIKEESVLREEQEKLKAEKLQELQELQEIKDELKARKKQNVPDQNSKAKPEQNEAERSEA